MELVLLKEVGVCYLQFVSIVVIDFIEISDQNICQTCNIYFML